MTPISPLANLGVSLLGPCGVMTIEQGFDGVLESPWTWFTRESHSLGSRNRLSSTYPLPRYRSLLFGYKVNADTNLFISRTGEPLLPRALSNGFKVIAERAGYPGLKYHFHESRHTHATLMLEQNVHPKIVQERLGHKDIETTLNTYSHVPTSGSLIGK